MKKSGRKSRKSKKSYRKRSKILVRKNDGGFLDFLTAFTSMKINEGEEKKESTYMKEFIKDVREPEKVAKIIDDYTEPPYLKILIIGNGGVGKTAFINAVKRLNGINAPHESSWIQDNLSSYLEHDEISFSGDINGIFKFYEMGNNTMTNNNDSELTRLINLIEPDVILYFFDDQYLSYRDVTRYKTRINSLEIAKRPLEYFVRTKSEFPYSRPTLRRNNLDYTISARRNEGIRELLQDLLINTENRF